MSYLDPAHCGIHNLPPETLNLVFHFLAIDTSSFTTERSVPHWLNILHVSRLWRSVALDCKTLWRVIHLNQQPWTHFFLEHSKPRNVVLHVTSPFDDGEHRFEGRESDYAPRKRQSMTSINVVCKQMSRIEEIVIMPAKLLGTSRAHYKHLPEFDSVYKVLEGLQSQCLRKIACAVHDFLNHDLFCGVPVFALQHLTLQACRMRWTQPILFGDLTSLKLKSTSLVGSFDDALSVLRRTASTLEHLEITWQAGIGIGAETPEREPVKMPRLKTLSLCDFAWIILPLFQHLSFPPHVDMYIECNIPELGFIPDVEDRRSLEEILKQFETTFARHLRPLAEKGYSFPVGHFRRQASSTGLESFTMFATSGSRATAIPPNIVFIIHWNKNFHTQPELARLWSVVPCTDRFRGLARVHDATTINEWLSVRERVKDVCIVDTFPGGLESLLDVLLDDRAPFTAIRGLTVHKENFAGAKRETFKRLLEVMRGHSLLVMFLEDCIIAPAQEEELSLLSALAGRAFRKANPGDTVRVNSDSILITQCAARLVLCSMIA
jgi:hypothetical protein